MSRNAAPVHGNYHGYYAKRPSIRDPRLEVLPTALFAGKCVLDVGCNEGWVSCEVAQIHAARKVVGVDIDDALIRAAWRRRRTVWSTQGPAPSLPSDGSSSSRKRKREEDAPAVLADYFPASCVHSVGPLPIPDSSPEIFPHNVAFRTADWVNEAIPEDAEGYDVVVAFSITKWIHLNGGDDGLIRFFERAASVLKPGGSFVVEPQAWETYRKARRMDKKFRDTATTLKLRPENFAQLLSKLGFGEPTRLGSVGEGGFNRAIDLYCKQPT